MKKIALLITVIFINDDVNAQKKVLSFSENDSWPEISNWHITSNGKYASYNIRDTLVIQSLVDTFKMKIDGTSDVQFNDNGYYSYLTKEHNLTICKFPDSQKVVIPDVKTQELFTIRDQVWVLYLKSDLSSSLVLRNLINGNNLIYDSVEDYFFNNDHTVLLIKAKKRTSEKDYLNNLLWIKLFNKNCYNVISGEKGDISNFCFDKSGTQLAFVISKMIEGESINEIYYFTPDMPTAKPWINSKAPGIDSSLVVENGEMVFSKDGTQFFFSLQKKKTEKIKIERIVSLDIWHYKDIYLQSQQLNGYNGQLKRDIMAVFNIKENVVIQLQHDGDASQSSYISRGAPDAYRLIQANYNEMESYWHPPAPLYIVSTITGERTWIGKGSRMFDPRFSLSGKYVIYFDRDKKNYFTYNIGNGKTVNVSSKIPYPVYDDKDDVPRKAFPINMSAAVGWLENDKWLLINDEFDLWLVDPTGFKAPMNVTSGYGRRNKIILRYTQTKGKTFNYDPVLINPDENLLFIGFNQVDKYNGFYQKKLFEKGNPHELYMGPYIFHYPFNNYSLYTEEPLKAKSTNVYLVKRMSPASFPNIYWTKNFKDFIQLSRLIPQSGFNWYTSELIRWQMFDGKFSEGILYKPENFDPHKKYPIIFTFYERDADKVNQFLYPRNSRGELNIPFYVSNGYLVFIPNVYYSIGHPAESVYNCIVSAAKFLSSKKWVDKAKMGLEGISFGGYEVNVLVSKSNIFAAAVECAGSVDLISAYGGMYGLGASGKFMYEDGQGRIGKTLWENPKAYIENSPIFSADKVTTPILIMHNKLDDAVSWDQGIEWFTALRRLGKKVWMLQYDNEGHGVSGLAAKKDYTIRGFQFFDHYLKNKPAPKWMTKGISASQKGIENGLELDSVINVSGVTIKNRFQK